MTEGKTYKCERCGAKMYLEFRIGFTQICIGCLLLELEEDAIREAKLEGEIAFWKKQAEFWKDSDAKKQKQLEERDRKFGEMLSAQKKIQLEINKRLKEEEKND